MGDFCAREGYFGTFLVLVLAALPGNADARYIAEQLLHGKSTFTEASLDAYLQGMDKLNYIQEKLLRLGGELNGANKNEEESSGEGGTEVRLTIERGSFEKFSASSPARRPDLIPYLFEGDIILSEQQLDAILAEMQRELGAKEAHAKGFGTVPSINGRLRSARNKRTMTASLALRWTNFPIPFVITEGVNAVAALEGIKVWESATCITFKQFSSPPAGASMQFIHGTGCYSNVGRNAANASQPISIGDGCDSAFVVAHEIGHALGYFHEQSRYDRDSYVVVATDNIQPQFLNQFTKQSPGAMLTYGVRYDLGSVMHYDPFGFSSSAKIGLLTLDPNAQDTIGQRFELSFNDMNFAYCNNTCKEELACLRSGYTDPKNCSRCRCPEGLGGALCDSIQQTTTDCGDLVRIANTTTTQTLAQSGAGRCNFIITARGRGKIHLIVESINFVPSTPCQPDSYVEIRSSEDLGNTGARFCRRIAEREFTSQSNEVLMLYRASSPNARFEMRFQEEGHDKAGDKLLPEAEEDTARSPLAPLHALGEWSECSRSCGGCGRQQRKILGSTESRFCNEMPCPAGGQCCEPFFFVAPSLCLKGTDNSPTGDETPVWESPQPRLSLHIQDVGRRRLE